MQPNKNIPDIPDIQFVLLAPIGHQAIFKKILGTSPRMDRASSTIKLRKRISVSASEIPPCRFKSRVGRPARSKRCTLHWLLTRFSTWETAVSNIWTDVLGQLERAFYNRSVSKEWILTAPQCSTGPNVPQSNFVLEKRKRAGTHESYVTNSPTVRNLIC